MRAVILAGGRGTRLQEETSIRPKPMIEIGDRPILWHIMKHCAHHRFDEFLIALGYRGEIIKRYFLDWHELSGCLTIDMAAGKVEADRKRMENWIVRLIDTGVDTNTGGRVRQLRPWLGEETFLVTYGDGVSDVDLGDLLAFHRAHGLLATVTAVRPPARFGGLLFDSAHPDRVARFTEKPQAGEGWINGGYILCEPGVFDYLEGDQSSLEAHALHRLAADGQLAAYRHDHFWQCMDTLRDKTYLQSLWDGGHAPWKVWP